MKRIIFFDGVCSVCNGFVDLIIKLDQQKKFYFSPLQGETAKKHGLEYSGLHEEEQSLYYIDHNDVSYKRSTAVIHIARDLFPMGEILLVLKVIPRILRDSLYSFIAKNRYRFFEKKSTCRIPSPEERERFLD